MFHMHVATPFPALLLLSICFLCHGWSNFLLPPTAMVQVRSKVVSILWEKTCLSNETTATPNRLFSMAVRCFMNTNYDHLSHCHLCVTDHIIMIESAD